MKRVVIFLTIGLILGLLGSRFLLTRSGNPEKREEIRTVEVKRGDIRSEVTETGTVEPARIVEIKSEHPGEVKQIFVGAGDKVEKGQKLAVIQQESAQARQVAQLRAEIEKEALNVKEARRDLKRNQILSEKGFIAQKEVETAEKRVEEAQTRFELAKKQLLLALGGDREAFERQLQRPLSAGELEEFVISSPISGTIMVVKVAIGEKVMSGTTGFGGGSTLITIADLSRLIVRSKINEVNVDQVQVGQLVDIRFDAIPGEVFEGAVVQIAPQGEKANNVVTYDVLVEITRPDERIKPLMTANIDIITGVAHNVLFLPVEALFREKGEDTVYVMEGDQRVARKVRVGSRTESYAVIQEGVKEGETVIIPSRPERA